MFEQEVANGIAWIKKNIEGGLERIDIDTLDVSNPCLCALSQAAKMPFYAACSVYDLGKIQQDHLGFNMPYTHRALDFGTHMMIWGKLTETWKEALRKEQSQKEVEITWLTVEEKSDNVNEVYHSLLDIFRAYCPPRLPAYHLRDFASWERMGRSAILDSPDWASNGTICQGVGESAQVIETVTQN